MTDRELLKEARNLIIMCSLLDKSGRCVSMADKIDRQLNIANIPDSLPFPVLILDGLKIDVEFKNGGLTIKSNDHKHTATNKFNI